MSSLCSNSEPPLLSSGDLISDWSEIQFCHDTSNGIKSLDSATSKGENAEPLHAHVESSKVASMPLHPLHLDELPIHTLGRFGQPASSSSSSVQFDGSGLQALGR